MTPNNSRLVPMLLTQGWFEIRTSPIQGKGAFAVRDIPAGVRLIEYVGDRIDDAESVRRYDDARMKRHHTFLFQVKKDLVIDAKTTGNESKYINHSCAPNCDSIDVRGRIFIESTKDIPAGAELVYDYRYTIDGAVTEEDAALYPCRCGAPNCRGTILTGTKKGAKRAAPPTAKKAKKAAPPTTTKKTKKAAKATEKTTKRARAAG